MDNKKLLLRHWIFHDVLDPPLSRQSFIRLREFPHYIVVATHVHGIPIRIQGFWLLFHRILYTYDLDLEVLPADYNAWLASPLYEYRNTPVYGTDHGLEESSTQWENTRCLTFEIVKFDIHIREITSLTFQWIVPILCNRFMKGWRKRHQKKSEFEKSKPNNKPKKNKKGKNTPPQEWEIADDWPEEMERAITLHPWYRKNIREERHQQHQQQQADKNNRVMEWYGFLQSQYESHHTPIEEDIQAEENEDETDSKKRKRKKKKSVDIRRRGAKGVQVRWESECIIASENADYYCVTHYKLLLSYLPISSLIRLPVSTYVTLYQRLHDLKDYEFYRSCFGGEDTRKLTDIKIWDTSCPWGKGCIHSSFSQSSSKKGEKVRKTSNTKSKRNSNPLHLQSNTSPLLGQKQKRKKAPSGISGKLAKKQKGETKQRMGRMEESMDESIQSRDQPPIHEENWEAIISNTYWDKEAKLTPWIFKPDSSSSSSSSSCPCIDFQPCLVETYNNREAEGDDVEDSKDTPPANLLRIWAVLSNWKEKLLQVDTPSTMNKHWPYRVDSIDNKPFRRDHLKDDELDHYLDMYQIKINPVEVFALQYGNWENWKLLFPGTERLRELRKLRLYHALLSDMKLSGGSTILHGEWKNAEQDDLKIKWSHLSRRDKKANMKQFREQWRNSFDFIGLENESKTFHTQYFLNRFGHNCQAWYRARRGYDRITTDHSMTEYLTLEELAAFDVLLEKLADERKGTGSAEGQQGGEEEEEEKNDMWQPDEDEAEEENSSLAKRKEEESASLSKDKLFLQSIFDFSIPEVKSPIEHAQSTSTTYRLIDLIQRGLLVLIPHVDKKIDQTEAEKEEEEEEQKEEEQSNRSFSLSFKQHFWRCTNALVNLCAWYRHTMTRFPFAIGLFHPDDLSPSARQLYFPEYAEFLKRNAPRPSAASWFSFLESYQVGNMGEINIEDIPNGSMSFYTQWAPPVVNGKWNPFFLYPSDVRLGEGQNKTLKPYPPASCSLKDLTFEYYQATSISRHFPLDPFQQSLVDAAARYAIIIIEGDAGSGKSRTIQVVRGLDHHTIIVLVPTHEVRQHVSKKTRFAMTANEFVEKARDGGIRRNGWESVRAIVIDEMSMISETLSCEIISMFPQFPCLMRVFIIGSDKQLPPPGGGQVLKNWKTLTQLFKVCVLKNNHRVRRTKKYSNQEKNALVDLADFTKACWVEDWDKISQYLYVPRPIPLQFTPFDKNTSVEQLMAIQKEALELQSRSMESSLQSFPPSLLHTDLLTGLRIVPVTSKNETQMLDYMYQCIHDRITDVRCVTQTRDTRTWINQEMMKRHIQFLQKEKDCPDPRLESLLNSTIKTVNYGLLEGIPIRVWKKTYWKPLTSMGGSGTHEPVFINDVFWVHEILLVEYRAIYEKSRYDGPKVKIHSTSYDQVIAPSAFPWVKHKKTKVTQQRESSMKFGDYLFQSGMAVIVRLSRDPPVKDIQRTMRLNWNRPTIPKEPTWEDYVTSFQSPNKSTMNTNKNEFYPSTPTKPRKSSSNLLATPVIAKREAAQLSYLHRFLSGSPLRRSPSTKMTTSVFSSPTTSSSPYLRDNYATKIKNREIKCLERLQKTGAIQMEATRNMVISLESTFTEKTQGLTNGEWFHVSPVVSVVTPAFCQTIASMQGSERNDIHVVLDSYGGDSTNLKVAISRAREHCDIYVRSKSKAELSEELAFQQARQYVFNMLQKPSPEIRTTLFTCIEHFMHWDPNQMKVRIEERLKKERKN